MRLALAHRWLVALLGLLLATPASAATRPSEPAYTSSMPDDPPTRPPSGGPEQSIARMLVRDPALRILMITGVLIIATMGSWTLSLAFRARSPSAIVALLLLAFGSFEAVRLEVRTERRAGPAAALVAVVWGLSAAGAWAGARLKSSARQAATSARQFPTLRT